MAEVESYLSERDARRRRRRWYVSAVGFFAVFCGAVLAVGWVMLRSPWLQVKDVSIAGAEEVPAEAILTLLRARVPGESFARRLLGYTSILAWPEGLVAEDLKLLPRVKQVAFEKDYRAQTITARVVERVPFAIWCAVKGERTECFWFDEEGITVARAPRAEGNLIKTVNDYSREELRLGEPVLPGELLGALRSVFRVLAAAEFGVKEIRLEDIGLQELKVALYDGPGLYFSLRFPSDTALGVLQSLVSSGSFKTLKYVDFRAENRAYYK